MRVGKATKIKWRERQKSRVEKKTLHKQTVLLALVKLASKKKITRWGNKVLQNDTIYSIRIARTQHDGLCSASLAPLLLAPLLWKLWNSLIFFLHRSLFLLPSLNSTANVDNYAVVSGSIRAWVCTITKRFPRTTVPFTIHWCHCRVLLCTPHTPPLRAKPWNCLQSFI